MDKGSGYLLAKAYYTPQIPATILSPDAMAKAFRCRAYQTYSDFVGDQTRLTLVSCNSEADNISIALQRKRGLLFTDPLLMPTDADRVAISSNAPACRATCCGESTSSTCDLCLPVSQVTASPPDGSDLFPSWRSTIIDPLEDYMCPQHINALTNDQRRALWHLRLGHINLPQVVNAHKFADGIPKLPRHDVLHSCPMCLRSKLHKAPSNKTEDIDLDGAECWQHVQMDFGFIVQKSRCLDEEEADAEAMGMTTIRLPRLVFMSWELAMLLSHLLRLPPLVIQRGAAKLSIDMFLATLRNRRRRPLRPPLLRLRSPLLLRLLLLLLLHRLLLLLDGLTWRSLNLAALVGLRSLVPFVTAPIEIYRCPTRLSGQVAPASATRLLQSVLSITRGFTAKHVTSSSQTSRVVP